MSSAKGWKDALLRLKPPFEAAARTFPDLQMVFWRDEFASMRKPISDMLSKEFGGREPTGHISWWYELDDKIGPADRVWLYGEHDGAKRFVALAQCAGNVVHGHVDWLRGWEPIWCKDEDAENWDTIYGPYEPEVLWVMVVFGVAWEGRSDIPFYAAQKTWGPQPTWVSIFPANPFWASAIAIDVLLADIARKEKRAQDQGREKPGKRIRTEPRAATPGAESTEEAAARIAQVQPERPEWDKEKRELRLGGKVLKQYKRKAENQTRILASFEELGWPQSIDSPFNEKEFKRRDDAIRELNKIEGIRFFGDGTGEHIRWKWE